EDDFGALDDGIPGEGRKEDFITNHGLRFHARDFANHRTRSRSEKTDHGESFLDDREGVGEWNEFAEWNQDRLRVPRISSVGLEVEDGVVPPVPEVSIVAAEDDGDFAGSDETLHLLVAREFFGRFRRSKSRRISCLRPK